MLKNRPSEHRPEEWSQQNRYCGVTVDARHVPPGGAHYHHLRQRSHQTSAHSLEHSKANQRVRGPRESAERRREREDRKTPQIERFCSKLPDEPAIQREHESQRQKVAARDPLNGGKTAVQINGQAGEGDVHHSCIALSHEGPKHSDSSDLPDQWIEPIESIELMLCVRQVRRGPPWSSARDRAEAIPSRMRNDAVHHPDRSRRLQRLQSQSRGRYPGAPWTLPPHW